MPQQTPAQRRASDAVAAWMAARRRNNAWLVDVSNADPGTIGDFLNGRRWPKLGTQGRIEAALGWPSGTIRQIGNGADVDIDALVGGPDHDATYVSSPGARAEAGITNEDLLREILRSRSDYDQLRAEVRSVSERVDKLEQRGS